LFPAIFILSDAVTVAVNAAAGHSFLHFFSRRTLFDARNPTNVFRVCTLCIADYMYVQQASAK
jgi:hypothetical protein